MSTRPRFSIPAAVALIGCVIANVGAQNLPHRKKHNDDEMLPKCRERLEQNPGLYFYVARNGLGGRVLRCTKTAQSKNPDGFHPMKKPLVRDLRLELREGQFSEEGIRKLREMCEAHNRLAPTQKVIQKKPPQPKKKGRGKRPAPPKKKPAQPKMSEVAVRPLPAARTSPNERFSDNQKRLLQIVSAPYELAGETVTPAPDRDDLEFILSMTRSRNEAVSKAAILTCIIHECNSPFQADSEYQNLTISSEPAQRMRAVAKSSLQSGKVNMSVEFDRLVLEAAAVNYFVESNVSGGGIVSRFLDNEREALRRFGQELDEEIFTSAFRSQNQGLKRMLAVGTAVADSRSLIEQVAAASAVGEKASTPALRVRLVHEDRMAKLEISNRTRKTQRNVLITSRSIADPEQVSRASRGKILQQALLRGFGVVSQDANAEASDGIILWNAIQKLDTGSVFYLPEMRPSATIKVTLCDEDRLSMTSDIRVSFWSDDLMSRDISSFNIEQVLNDLAASRKSGFVYSSRTRSWVAGESQKPVRKTPEQIRREREQAVRNRRIAEQSIQLARFHLKNGNVLAARVQLSQAIRLSPESPAGRQAKVMLEKLGDP